MVALLLVMVVVAHLLVDCSPMEWHQQTPCEDQAPPECFEDTVEQASSSQFSRYRYCACMTDDGAKGYIAADIQRGKID